MRKTLITFAALVAGASAFAPTVFTGRYDRARANLKTGHSRGPMPSPRPLNKLSFHMINRQIDHEGSSGWSQLGAASSSNAAHSQRIIRKVILCRRSSSPWPACRLAAEMCGHGNRARCNSVGTMPRPRPPWCAPCLFARQGVYPTSRCRRWVREKRWRQCSRKYASRPV